MLIKSNSKLLAHGPLRLSKHFRRAFGIFQVMALLLLSAVPASSTMAQETRQIDVQSNHPFFVTQHVEAVKFFHWMGDRSLRLDSAKRPHIVYGGDHLYYAYFNGSVWQFEIADHAYGVGKYASLALDKNNKPHAAYYDALTGSLKYARKTGAAWEIFTIDSSPVALQFSSNVDLFNSDDEFLPELPRDGRDWHHSIPGSGNLYNEEVEVLPGDVLFGEPYYSEGEMEMVDLEEEIQPAPEDDPEMFEEGMFAPQYAGREDKGRGQFTSIAVNSFGNPSISYYDFANGNLKFASYNGFTWLVTAIDTTGDVGLYSSIALGSSEYPHISYYDATKGNLKYVRWVGTAWTMPAVIDNGGDTDTTLKYAGLYSSLAVDRNNNPHISYYDLSNGNLKYARASSGAWTSVVVDSTGDVGLHTSIGVDNDLRAHISYYNATNADLKYAFCSGSSCSLQNVNTEGFVGRYSSLALDGSSPRISFYDSATGQLKYSFPSGSSWVVQVLDGAADVGLFSSLALSPNGDPRIAYFDDIRDNLKYAYWNGGSWNVSTVDQAGEVGLYASLALNKTTGYPSISYYDASNGRLKYASWVGTSWWIEAPDGGPDAGTHSALTLDGAGNPRIVYCKGKGCGTGKSTDPMEVRVALKTSNTWLIKTVETGGVGLYSSIATDSLGRLHLSYYDAANRRLKYALGAPDGSSWTVQTVDSNPKVGLFTSIAVDSSNRPHIAYFDDYLDRTRYAFWNGGWFHEYVDTSSAVGLYNTIAIDALGNPHVSYFDASNRHLKYAVRQNGTWSNQIVDSSGEVGMYASIALKGGVSPAISYYDATSGDLKYAFIASGPRTYLPIIRR
jgi:hypothetical protein